MLDLKQLKYFIVCAETGSISEAAKLLYTTQPSVSKAIKALEEEMGIVLFERMPRGIALTAKGREAYRYACRICLLYTSPSPRDISGSRMPSSA